MVPCSTANAGSAGSVRSQPGLEPYQRPRSIDYRTVAAISDCRWSDVPGDSPIVTDDQIATAIGTSVYFAGASPSLPNPYGPAVVGCEWTETNDTAVSVSVDEQDFTSLSAAAAQYQSRLSSVPQGGLVEANLKIDGKDAFVAQFNEGIAVYILVDERLVSVGIKHRSANNWTKPLTAIGSDLVARLLLQPPGPSSAQSVFPPPPAPCDVSRPQDEADGQDYGHRVVAFGQGAGGDLQSLNSDHQTLQEFTDHTDIWGPNAPPQSNNPEMFDGWWLAGFFDALATTNGYNADAPVPTPDHLTDLMRAYGEAETNSYPSTGEHLAYPEFYDSLDCALSTGHTSAGLSRDLLSQRDFLGLGGANNDDLVVGLVKSPLACLGLTSHLAAPELLTDFGQRSSTIDAAAFTVIATKALTVLGPDGVPFEIGDLVAPPYGPWSPGILDPTQALVLNLAAGETVQGHQAIVAAVQAEIEIRLQRITTSGAQPPADSYTAWAGGAANLMLIMNVPYARLEVNHKQFISVPDYHEPGDEPSPDIPDFVGSTEADNGEAGGVIIQAIQTIHQQIVAAENPADFKQLMLGFLTYGGATFPSVNEAIVTSLIQARRISAPGSNGEPGPPITQLHPLTALSTISSYAITNADGTATGLTVQALLGSVAAAYDTALDVALKKSDLDLAGDVVLGSSQVASILAEPGAAIIVSGSGFAPDTDVAITGHSTPVLLARARTNRRGDFATPVTVYHQLTPGRHILTGTGLAPNGRSRIISAPVNVETTPASGRPRGSHEWVFKLGGPVVLVAALLALGEW